MVKLKLPDGDYIATAGANKTQFSVKGFNLIGVSSEIYVKGICIDDTVFVRDGVLYSHVLGNLDIVELDFDL